MQNTVTIKTLRSTIDSLMSQGKASLQNVAEKLDTSPRTLQRQISYTGKSFSNILDEMRCEKACKLLRQSNTKINNIAAMLGYSDAGSFTRAFERWKKLPPQSYRNQYRSSKQ